MEMCEDIWQTLGMKDLYPQRKEMIERLFGTAKDGIRGCMERLEWKEMKVGLTFAFMNLKKLAKIKAKKGFWKKKIYTKILIWTQFDI